VGTSADKLLAGHDDGVRIPRDGSFLGALFESLATQSVRVYAQAAEATVSHLRTRAGEHEVDLIVERDDGAVLGVEVKLSRTVSAGDTKHLRWLRDRIGTSFIGGIVITTGPDAYVRADDGIAVVPLALLGP
jgi:predicted AAA+ superfamily ATPase